MASAKTLKQGTVTREIAGKVRELEVKVQTKGRVVLTGEKFRLVHHKTTNKTWMSDAINPSSAYDEMVAVTPLTPEVVAELEAAATDDPTE